MAVFWVAAPCGLVEVYQRFRGPCCLHHQGDESHMPITIAARSWLVVDVDTITQGPLRMRYDVIILDDIIGVDEGNLRSCLENGCMDFHEICNWRYAIWV
jgi:hypothetical protein